MESFRSFSTANDGVIWVHGFGEISGCNGLGYLHKEDHEWEFGSHTAVSFCRYCEFVIL